MENNHISQETYFEREPQELILFNVSLIHKLYDQQKMMTIFFHFTAKSSNVLLFHLWPIVKGKTKHGCGQVQQFPLKTLWRGGFWSCCPDRLLVHLSCPKHHPTASAQGTGCLEMCFKNKSRSSRKADLVPIVRLGGNCSVRLVLSATLAEKNMLSVEHLCFAFCVVSHFLLARFQCSCFTDANTHSKLSLSWL